jgi:hypothetical protein
MALTARYSCVGFDPSGFETPTFPRSRLIGLIRRECIDHVVVFGERHHVLLSYMSYYNGTRTHLSLDKDAPISRPPRQLDAFSVARFWAECTINMPGFDLR